MLCSFREISFPRSLFREELRLLLMRTTGWLSCRKPNRPHSEVTHPNSLDTSLPLSVYFVARLAFPRHHITSTTTNRMQTGESGSAPLCPRFRHKQTNFAESPCNHWCNVKSCVRLCFTVSNTALWLRVETKASRSSSHPNDWPHRVSVRLGNPPSADGVLIGVAVALPFSWRSESRTSESLSVWGSAHSALRGLQTEASQRRTSGVSGRTRKQENVKTKKGSATL